MKKQEPLVSVIIPTYNREKTIIQSIESVLSQSYFNIEVIVVDDNSSDNTQVILQNLSDIRIKYIRNNINKGPSGARNIGILEATGEFIAFEDSDDLWLPNKLELQMKEFERDSEIGMVYCAFEYKKGNLQYKVPSDEFQLSVLDGNIYHSLLECNKVGMPTVVLKKQCLSEVGLFNEDIKALEDWEFILRIANKFKIRYVNQILVMVYFSKNSVNFNHKNLLDANIYIANINMHKADYRLRLKNIVTDIATYISEITNSDVRDSYMEKIIPHIISSELEYNVISTEIQRTNKFKSNYEMAISLLELKEPELFFRQYFEKMKIRSVAVYGTGRVGRVLINILQRAMISIDYAIDQNMNLIEGVKVINPRDIIQETDLIIITIPGVYEVIKHELEKKINCNIIYLAELLQ